MNFTKSIGVVLCFLALGCGSDTSKNTNNANNVNNTNNTNNTNNLCPDGNCETEVCINLQTEYEDAIAAIDYSCSADSDCDVVPGNGCAGPAIAIRLGVDESEKNRIIGEAAVEGCEWLGDDSCTNNIVDENLMIEFRGSCGENAFCVPHATASCDEAARFTGPVVADMPRYDNCNDNRPCEIRTDLNPCGCPLAVTDQSLVAYLEQLSSDLDQCPDLDAACESCRAMATDEPRCSRNLVCRTASRWPNEPNGLDPLSELPFTEGLLTDWEIGFDNDPIAEYVPAPGGLTPMSALSFSGLGGSPGGSQFGAVVAQKTMPAVDSVFVGLSFQCSAGYVPSTVGDQLAIIPGVETITLGLINDGNDGALVTLNGVVGEFATPIPCGEWIEIEWLTGAEGSSVVWINGVLHATDPSVPGPINTVVILPIWGNANETITADFSFLFDHASIAVDM